MQLFALMVLCPALLRAQAGGAGAAGAGASSGASGPGAGAAAHGAPAPGQAAPAGAPGTNASQSAASAYAASASVGVDPRKPPQSRPGAYTLQQILEMARAKNPTFLAAEQNLNAVRAQEVQAGVRTNPYFTLYGTNVSEGPAASTPYAVSAQVSRLFERGEKRRWRLDAARATTAQTRAQLEDTIRQTELTLRTAFTHMLIAKEALQLSEASLKDFEHEIEIARDRYQAGDLSKLDYERLDLQLGAFESDAANSRIALLQAAAQLQTLAGAPAHFARLRHCRGHRAAARSADRSRARAACARQPAGLRCGEVCHRGRAGQRAARAGAGHHRPHARSRVRPQRQRELRGASFNIPLRIFDRNQGNKATTRFQVTATQFTATAARNQVVSDVDQAFAGYVESKRLSDRFGSHYLDESTDVLSIAQYAFNHGGIALIDYLDALRDARTSTSDALNAFQQTWLAMHQLSAAANQDLAP